MSAQQVLDALGDPTRRRVFELLRDGPVAVGEIAEQLPVSRPAVSKHLKVLGESGLVTHVRVGTRSLYRIDARGLEALRDYLDGFWTDVLDAFAEHVAQAERAADPGRSIRVASRSLGGGSSEATDRETGSSSDAADRSTGLASDAAPSPADRAAAHPPSEVLEKEHP